MTRTELRAIFRREKERFGVSARLRIAEGRCVSPGKCAYRNLAFVDIDTREVVIHERALTLLRSNVVGLIRHELGHLVDPDVDRLGSERRADRLAELITGQPIYYDQDDVQTTRPGRRRPAYLPR